MNKDTQLIWEAFLGESYFDSHWKLPEGHEDWRVKNKDEDGVIPIPDELAVDLMLKGSKPMTMLDTDDKKQKNMLDNLVRMGWPAKEADKHPDPKRHRNLVFVGITQDWVEKGVQAWYDNDDIEIGKALGFGEHSKDLSDPEYQAKAMAMANTVTIDGVVYPVGKDGLPIVDDDARPLPEWYHKYIKSKGGDVDFNTPEL